MKTNGYRIFEENVCHRKGTRKKKTGLRILSMGLALSMLLIGCEPSVTPLAVTGVRQLEAASQKGNEAGTDTVITGFGRLSEEIRKQTVPLGTTMEELNLPDTLEAYVTEKDAWNDRGGGKTARRS